MAGGDTLRHVKVWGRILFLSRYTKRVVIMEKAAPNPRTTMHPTAWERGASPSIKLDMPAYSEGWLLVTSCRTVFVTASIFLQCKKHWCETNLKIWIFGSIYLF